MTPLNLSGLSIHGLRTAHRGNKQVSIRPRGFLLGSGDLHLGLPYHLRAWPHQPLSMFLFRSCLAASSISTHLRGGTSTVVRGAMKVCTSAVHQRRAARARRYVQTFHVACSAERLRARSLVHSTFVSNSSLHSDSTLVAGSAGLCRCCGLW